MPRSILLFALVLVILIGAALIMVFGRSITFAVDRVFAATPSESGEIEIVMTDYRFIPDVIRVKAGQEIRLTLRNESQHTHEFMVGRQVTVEDGVTEPPTPDFFAGLQPVITGSGMPMGFEGMAGMQMEGMTMEEEGMPMEEGMEMKAEEMQMGGTETKEEGMQMGEGMPVEEGMEMKAEEMQMGETGMKEEGARIVLEGVHTEAMEMDAHGGGMVMLNPTQESTIVMTIPADKVGVWEFGCFQEEGLHYDDGMRGVLIVEQ
ncbi:MAG: cupredoxin domain-containing protein [Chloroflexota bacterium]